MEPDRFARARILLEQNRYDLAAREVTARLADDPNDPEGYILLGICQCNLKDPKAIDTARTAVELTPNEDRAHFVYSLAQLRKGNLDEAERAIRRAIEINCWNSGYFGQLAAIEVGRYRWTEALTAADQGLALDPDDRHCLNLRAVALTKLGRKSEAASTLEGALEKNPEDAYSHANRGWTLLHENEPKKAIEHFRESLRLDPTSAWAKEGMLEALRARSWFYRRVLQYLLWMSRFPPRVQFGLLIGLIVLVRMLGTISRQYPAAAGVITVFILGYVAFAAASWFAKHIMNVVLLASADGRMILDRSEKWISGTCTILVALTLALAAIALVGKNDSYGHAALTLFLVAVHFASVVNIPFGRFLAIGIAASVLTVGAYGVSNIQRVEMDGEFERLRAHALRYDQEGDMLRLAMPAMTAEQQIQMEQTRARQLESLKTTAGDWHRHDRELEDRISMIGLASLGALFLHPVLIRGSQRAGR